MVRVGVALAALAALAAFLWVLMRVTLTPIPGAADDTTGNTRPGESLRFYLNRPSVKDAVIQVGGNLALMMPFGVILPLVSRRFRGLLRVGLVVALFSLSVEVVQGFMIVGRSFDADDVILNTAGAMLAYLLIGRKVSGWVHSGRSSARAGARASG
ncbi:VanZ family protein [Spirillospora sp. NPDC047279]|uniref:VanZ family protein n=1 Tax=Spirillospora sp. NPDC047279 TaxID=3155478 RepID=UPI003408BA65